MTKFVGFSVVPLLALAALAAAAAGAFLLLKPGEAAADLVIIGPHNETTRTEIGNAFAEWHEEKYGKTIRIAWVDLGGTSTSRKYVLEQFGKREDKNTGIGIDLFFGGGVHTFETLAREDLLLPHSPGPETLKQIQAESGGKPIYDAKSRWHGVVLSSFGLIYNGAVGKRYGMAEPTSWRDLAQPRFFGWATGADPRRSGSIGKIFSIILSTYGWEEGMSLLIRYGGNARAFTEASSSIAKDVTFGDAMLGPIIDSYGNAMMTETGGKVRFILPAGETQITADPVAILKGAPHRKIAERFVDFLLSKQGQRIWMLKRGAKGGPRKRTIGRMPVRRDLYDEHLGKPECAVALSPYSTHATFRSKMEESIDHAILTAYIAAVLIDARDELIAAWKIIKDLEPGSAAWRALTTPGVTETQIRSITREQWKDHDFRRQTTRRWAARARTQYRRALQMAEGKR